MPILQKYLVKQSLGVFAGILLLIVGVLSLERLLRIIDIVSHSPGSLSEATLMLIYLLPHYLGIAIPAAIFMSILITISRLSRSGEIVSIWGQGQSLFLISRPYFYFSILMMVCLITVTGLLKPLTRYNYSKIVNSFTQSSIETAFQEGKFVQSGEWIIWTEKFDRNSGELQSPFLVQRDEAGDENVISAPLGKLQSTRSQMSGILFQDGAGLILQDANTKGADFNFDQFNWLRPDATTRFRARGKDEREFTIFELHKRSLSSQLTKDERVRAVSSVHDQLARCVLLIIFPLIAIPFGLSYGRIPPSNAVLIGLLFLIGIQKVMDLAKDLSEDSMVPPGVGSWIVVGVVAIFGIILFLRSAITIAEPPLSALKNVRLPRRQKTKSIS